MSKDSNSFIRLHKELIRNDAELFSFLINQLLNKIKYWASRDEKLS